jgi:peptidoglycan/LPS O-acetylase OafA/YrhL
MANRATGAFVFSVIGAAYQMISLYIGVLIDRNAYSYYSYVYTLFFSSFLAFWAASHILEDWKGRITWPSIILGLGVANLSTVILGYYAQSSPIYNATSPPSITPILALTPGPLLLIIGGILGFSAVRQYSREHGRAVIGHA